MNNSSRTKLRPIENLTQVDKIEISLQEYFKSENFLPGHPLPKEMELAKEMGVSRTAIREALSRFKTLGIIESRKNRGMVISQPDFLKNMNRVLHINLLDHASMKDIFEMRLVLEIGIADILFLRKTAASLEKIEAIVAQEEKTTNKVELVRLDVEFHSMLYKISGNNTIQRFQKTLLPIFDYVYNSFRKPNRTEKKDAVTHRQLLTILKKGTPEEFRNKMRSHLSMYFNQI